MFDANVYSGRRAALKKLVGNGIVLFPGNTEAAFNYPSNQYHFRQDSNFLYFFGLDHPDLAGVIDIDEDRDYIFGDDVDMDDIIWMGPQPTMKDRASEVGVSNTHPMKNLSDFLKKAISKGRNIHFTAPYRGETFMLLEELLGIRATQIKSYVSASLTHAVVKLRSVKDELEIAEIEKAIETAYDMHTTVMKLAKPGIVERELAGRIEGISLSGGGSVSFLVILSIHGETLHNHYHGNTLTDGRMVVTDAGAETEMHYASDITRTVPVGGKFNDRQREIYEIVLKANMEAIEKTKPGVPYRDVHLHAATVITEGLKALGIMKGDTSQAVANGAHALFMPHGLGHMMGLDVHDMEGLGEDLVGYDQEIKRSNQFGLAALRLGRKLLPGFVLTDEPGIYFIPELIDRWKSENKFTEFINYEKVENYRDFGGIRIEDDLLVTDTGCRVLGKPIPKTVAEVEQVAAG